MRQLWAKQWVRVAAQVIALLGLVVLLVCWRFHIWSYRDYQVYEEVRQYPVGEDLWFGRVVAGQSLEALTAAHPPHRTRQFGRFTQLSYYAVWPTPPGSVQMESLSVIAADGRLIHAVASGCTWERSFFEMSAEEAEEFHESYERRLREKGLLP